MKKHLVGTVIVAGLVLSSALALAGGKSSVPLAMTGTMAEGSMATVRASGDTVSYIGCEIIPGGAYCMAYNGTTGLWCYSNNAAFVAAASSITESSEIYFTASSGTCNYIEVSNLSLYAPMTP